MRMRVYAHVRVFTHMHASHMLLQGEASKVLNKRWTQYKSDGITA